MALQALKSPYVGSKAIKKADWHHAGKSRNSQMTQYE
jgi:hypothetical protein